MKNPLLSVIVFSLLFTAAVFVAVLVNVKLQLGIPSGIIPFMFIPFIFVIVAQQRKPKKK